MTALIAIFYGPPFAGKTTILQAFAQRHSLVCESFSIRPEMQGHTERGYRVVGPHGRPLALTIPGAVWSMATWSEVLAPATPIVLVLDPQESRWSINLQYADYVSDLRRNIAGFQVTKTDLVEPHKADAVAAAAAERLALRVPIVLSTTTDAASLSALADRLISGL